MPWHYGPGFEAYGRFRGEEFQWAYRDTYWEIVSDIDNGWPLALLGGMDIPGYPKKQMHWVAIKGYFWSATSHNIVVTDSAYKRCDWCIPKPPPQHCDHCTVCECPNCAHPDCHCLITCPDPAIRFCPRDWRTLDWDAIDAGFNIQVRISDTDN